MYGSSRETPSEAELRHAGKDSWTSRIKCFVEKRLKPRLQANKSVLVLHENEAQSAILVDVSATGFGLSKISNLKFGDFVIVVMPDGGMFDCRVVWSAGDRCGVSILK